MTCASCGQPAINTPFCPQCGAPVPEAPVAAAPPPALAPAPAPAPAPTGITIINPVAKLEWAALGLVLLAQLTWRGVPPITSWLAAPILLVALAAWGAHHIAPTLLERVPRWPTARTLELVTVLLLFTAVMRAHASLGFLLQLAAVVLLARALPLEAPENRLIDVPSLWRGRPAQALTGLLFLLCLTFAAEWKGSFHLNMPGTDTMYGYTVDYGPEDAWDQGYGTFLALPLAIAVLGLVVVTWRRGRIGFPLLLAGLGLAFLRALWILIEDARYVGDLQKTGNYPQYQAGAPTWFCLFLVPTVALSIWLWRRERTTA